MWRLYKLRLFLNGREKFLIFHIKKLDKTIPPEQTLNPTPKPTPEPTVFDTFNPSTD